MDDKQTRFEEQEAPLKNTDHAFVQVSEDGSPRMPQESGQEGQEQDKKQNDQQHEQGTTRHR